MTMKLLKFRVTGFRSVEDSGYIDVSTVTALIGTNESGKTNLLVPLWKLHPAKDGDIDPIADYPRKRYNELRSMEEKPIFIEALFELPDDLAEKIADIAQCSPADVRIGNVRRRFDGTYYVSFPEAKPARTVAKAQIFELMYAGHEPISIRTNHKSASRTPLA